MITLVSPNKSYDTEIFDYKREMIANGDDGLSGCGGLDRHTSYDEWMSGIEMYKDRNNLPENGKYVEGSQWLLVNTETKRVLGMVNIRHYLNDHLLEFGGHIGYSVRPSERRKGYAKLQLSLALQIVHDLGEKKILVTCSDDNIGSYKTIEACGGVLENIAVSEEYGTVRRYWITLE